MRLDSFCDGAPEAPRSIAGRDSRHEKKSAYISLKGDSEPHRRRAEQRKSRESSAADSQNPVRGSILQALDAARRRSLAPRFSSAEEPRTSLQRWRAARLRGQ
jgi:hypothetical protein